ncbi:MAG: NAD-dependent epimerase/dehydratase family protein [Ilumatobacteraceae bacterium]
MTAVPQHSTIAVTGAAGFIGGWVVRDLLDRGHRVRACVRDASDDTKVGFLRAMHPHASGRLTLHEADLDRPGCFDDVFRGCDGVAHVSHVSTYDDAEYVQRTCDHIVASVERSGSVRRVVVTSSVAAVISEADITELVRRPVCDEDRYPDESNPKRTPERGQGYSIGKVIAQRACADAAAASATGWDAITVCPADNVGPIQSAHQASGGPWQHLIEQMLRGRCRIFQGTGPYRPWMTVDVRDDAVPRRLDRERPGDQRRTLHRVVDRAARLRRRGGDDRPGAARAAPRPRPDRRRHARAPPGREAEFRSIWAGLELRNDRIRSVVPIEFRPLDDSIRLRRVADRGRRRDPAPPRLLTLLVAHSHAERHDARPERGGGGNQSTSRRPRRRAVSARNATATTSGTTTPTTSE